MKDVASMGERLGRFLATREEGRTAIVERYAPMTGGYSRLMAKADIRWDDGTVETLVLRGDPPAGESMLDTDRDVEWEVLQGLTQLGTVPMPAARYYDATGEHLGTKCIVLDCTPGPSLQSALEAADDILVHRNALIDGLAAVHAVPIDDLASCLPRPASWDAYLDERIALWAQTEGMLAESNPIMRYVGAWIDAHRPPPMDLVLCHGDFQSPNALLHPEAGLQLIDWEYAHIGDPREDLGWYLVVSEATPPSMYSPDPGAFLARYRERTGSDEVHVNEATIGYFSMVAMVKIFAGIILGASAMARGTNASLLTTFNLNAIAIGHMNCLGACGALAEPLAALREMAQSLEVQR